MRPSWAMIGWLPLVLLTACVASHPGAHHAGTIQPAVDRLLGRGDIEVAQTHLRAFGTQARSMASIHLRRKPPCAPTRPPMVSRFQGSSIARRMRS
jgi:hypothetical protein